MKPHLVSLHKQLLLTDERGSFFVEFPGLMTKNLFLRLENYYFMTHIHYVLEILLYDEIVSIPKMNVSKCWEIYEPRMCCLNIFCKMKRLSITMRIIHLTIDVLKRPSLHLWLRDYMMLSYHCLWNCVKNMNRLINQHIQYLTIISRNFSGSDGRSELWEGDITNEFYMIGILMPLCNGWSVKLYLAYELRKH